jgi:hypothetical protein
MRATLTMILALAAALPAAPPAVAQDAPVADEPAAETVKAKEEKEFRVPPGFRTKKRGKHVVYCRKEEVMGTRFQSEKCYDESGIREWLRAQVENQKQLDQMRRICGSQDACGGGG